MPGTEFLESYGGQSLDELLRMEQTHRIDSLVLAIESALQTKAEARGPQSLSQEERTVLAIEALEREVNNGGYEQFFLNSSNEYAADVVSALEAIGCPKNAAIARRAITALGLAGPPTPARLEEALENGGDELSDTLRSFNDDYYSCDEPIADRLFEFVRAHRQQIDIS
jgi:hypothetical protein